MDIVDASPLFAVVRLIPDEGAPPERREAALDVHGPPAVLNAPHAVVGEQHQHQEGVRPVDEEPAPVARHLNAGEGAVADG